MPTDAWSELAVLLVLLVPFLVLYGAGMSSRREVAEPWRATFLVFATILVPFVGFQLLDVLGGSADDSIHSVWIFGLMAAAGAAAALWGGALQAGGFGALGLLVAWVAFWDEVLGDPSGGTVRWLLVVVAAIFVATAVVFDRLGARQGAGLITAAGLATGYAGVLGELGPLGALGPLPVPGPTARTIEAAEPGAFWDAFLLLTSMALVAFSARTGRRGPGLVGAAGLAAFVAIVGAQLGDALGGGAEGDLAGWPLVLLAGGAAALVVSFAPATRPRTASPREPAPSRPRPPDRAAARS
ncbi:MAG TPA: hypothetical protein VF529_16740 [Solirubrobacteraceae bacterium]|jgi:hypothetical protein